MPKIDISHELAFPWNAKLDFIKERVAASGPVADDKLTTFPDECWRDLDRLITAVAQDDLEVAGDMFSIVESNFDALLDLVSIEARDVRGVDWGASDYKGETPANQILMQAHTVAIELHELGRDLADSIDEQLCELGEG